MRISVVLVGFLAVVLSVTGVVWLVHGSPGTVKAPGADPAAPKPPKEDPPPGRPKISSSGPQPKAVVEETKFEFGRMELGEKRSHTFTIRNEGEAPLVIKKGPTTCQCTVSDLNKGEIEPGGVAEITLTWEPKAETDAFSKGGEIWTNDPKHESISLTVEGIVTSRLMVFPDGAWEVASFREDQESKIAGSIVSPIVENFEVTGLECDEPFVTLTAEKITDVRQLKSMKGLSGYTIKVTIRPEMAVGGFNIPVRIKTDLTSAKTGEQIVRTVMIRGNRRGPIRVSGPAWVDNRSIVGLGAFDSREGKKVTLTLLVIEPPAEGLQVSETTCDPEEMKVTLIADESFKRSVSRYFLTFEYPAGSPRATRGEELPGKVKLKTNHPKAPEMDFQVLFTAY